MKKSSLSFWLPVFVAALLWPTAFLRAEFHPADLPPDMTLEDNVVYKTVDGKNLVMALFYPKVKKFDHAPVVVYIHGGGWSAGDRFTMTGAQEIDVIHALTQLGFVGATIEYRLTTRVIGPVTALQAAADCKDAIHFLVKNADRFGIDPNRMGTFGISAGAHLCMVTALGRDSDYPCDPDLAKYPGKILAAAAYFGQFSFVDPALFKGHAFGHPDANLPRLLGGPLAEKKDVAEKLSPTLLVKSDSPAVLLTHGADDKSVTPQNSIVLAEICKEKGVPVDLTIVQGADHIFKGDNIKPSRAEIVQHTVNFFVKYLLPSSAPKPAAG